MTELGAREDATVRAHSGIRPYNDAVAASPEGADWIALLATPLPIEAAVAWATTPSAGAVVSFLGVVRDHSDGRTGVVGLGTRGRLYEDEAVRVLNEIAAETRRRWPDVERVALLHRTGELALSEPSVAVVVSSPHRNEAFEAARFCIDTLKTSAPIWKREHWSAGRIGPEPTRPSGRWAQQVPELTASEEAAAWEFLVLALVLIVGVSDRDPPQSPSDRDRRAASRISRLAPALRVAVWLETSRSISAPRTRSSTRGARGSSSTNRR